MISKSVDPSLHMSGKFRPKTSLPGCEITVLIPIYNKARYLNLSIGSIFRLPIDPRLLCILCYDDGSTDSSTKKIKSLQQNNPRLFFLRSETNRGTLFARIALIEAVTTPWMVFLDPDDEFVGNGLVEAFQLAKSRKADIVQFGCRMALRFRPNLTRCWREPRRISVANRTNLIPIWLKGRIDVHLHRKVWKTELFQRAVSSMPDDLKEMRILRTEDTLLYGYVLLNMKGLYYYIRTVGEIRHYGWPDCSQSQAYQPRNATNSQMQFVENWIQQLFKNGGKLK
jgi:glycosyltransferase involved in cell wall biosynthesis